MKIPLFAAVVAAVAGCATPPPVIHAGPDPADSAAPVAASRYTPVMSGTADYRPVEPKSWRDQNERVAPGGRTR